MHLQKQVNSPQVINKFQDSPLPITLQYVLYVRAVIIYFIVLRLRVMLFLLQRKEYVMSMRLCLNCLKPNHVAHDCRSNYRCKVKDCGRKHNTLLHEERPAASVQQQANHQTNAATYSDEDEVEDLAECLLMTSQVNLTGPTGKVITVRALLDSGSTLSILSSKVMKHLFLNKIGKYVSISGVSNKSTKKDHPLAKVTLSSNFKQDWSRKITVAGMDELTRELPLQEAHYVRSMDHIKHLSLADEQFDQPGKIDILLGQNIWRHLFLEGKSKGTEDQPEAWLTVFGWTILGTYNPNSQAGAQSAITYVISPTEGGLTTDQWLCKFWQLEEPSAYVTEKTPTEVKVEEFYERTHSYDSTQNQYTVRLPRSEDKSGLGESRTQALNRARANERSLIRKDKLLQFQAVMQEYLDLGHAQPISLKKHQPTAGIYYMPIHAVFKESSTTTKVRAVFDASAKTTNQKSLNDLLAVGPTLHPTLDQILLVFRSYAVVISGDITKMYREVLLHPEDRPLHRFIWRPNEDSQWKDYEMSRVTFGVAVSPYLAVKTLQQAAQDFGKDYPQAQWHIRNSFYVDDLMGGADTPKDAIELYHNLCHILSQASFHLRKWRSNSSEVLEEIPVKIQEALPTQDLVDMHSATYPKALGVAWGSRADTMSTHVNLPVTYVSTKRGIVSDIARTFDVLVWLSPAILPMKLLYRDLWKAKLDWGDEVGQQFKVKERHKKWRDELHILSDVKLPRHYFSQKKPATVELHGFSDASMEAYAAVVFIRATYPTGSPSTQLVISKTKVTPPETRTMPQLELCGANLLAKLLTTTRQTLNVPLENVYAYSDSTIVLAWLDGQPKRHKIYVANRISSTVNLIPTRSWRYVPTAQNPADAASRGLTAMELKTHNLWWHEPPWQTTQPVDFPPQPASSILKKLSDTEAKPVKEEVVTGITPKDCIESRFGSYKKLLRVFCWIKRLAYFIHTKNRRPEIYLTVSEARDATTALVRRSQQRSFPTELKNLTADPPQDIPKKSTILVLRPRVDGSKLLKIGGRLNHTQLPDFQKHPVILSAQDIFTKLLFLYYHHLLGHCGPSMLLAHASNIYHVVGGRRLSRIICSKCITCRKAAVKASTQLLGQLPPARVEPHYVFLHTGMDFAGPFMIKQGYTRKPVEIEAHLAVFVCFCTKPVHLELVSDQTTQAFLAALDRFVDRRGLPLHLYSDNGPNFTGAKNKLHKFYDFVNSTECQNAVQSYVFDYEITWHNIPQRAPHFGGLWEAAVKAAKYHLKRIVGQHKFTFEELSTICCNVESFMNSRPLRPITSHDIDGFTPLTPSHFLIGRAARAYPKERIGSKPTILQRWQLCQQASQQFWDRWSREYLQQLQKATKWHKKNRNYQVGDLVMLTDGNAYHCQWTMDKIVAVYPGADGVVRAVDIQLEKRVMPTDYKSKQQLIKDITTKTSVYRRPVSKLAMLLGDEVPGKEVNLDDPVEIDQTIDA